MPELDKKDGKGQVIPFMQDGSFFYKKGIDAYKNHHMDQAIYYIERAIKMEPDEPIFPCQLAIFLSEKGEYEEANQWLQTIIDDIDRTMYECYFFMANNLAHLGEFLYAKHYLNKYLQMEPEGEFSEDAESLLMMIEEEIDEHGDEWMEESPLTIQIERILDYLHRGEYESAEDEARMTILESPLEWDAYAYLAESLMYQGEYEEAKSILQDLLMKNEPNFLARCIYTMLLTKEKDKEAPVWLKNIMDLRPMNDTHRYYLGKTLFLLGEYDKANKWFYKLSQQYKFRTSPIFLHQKAILACKNGKFELAEKLWEDVKQLDKPNESMVKNYARLLKTNELFSYPNERLFLYTELTPTEASE